MQCDFYNKEYQKMFRLFVNFIVYNFRISTKLMDQNKDHLYTHLIRINLFHTNYLIYFLCEIFYEYLLLNI